MEEENTQHGHIIEFRRDIPDLRQGGSKLCDEVPCGFSDAATNSKDAHERAAAMRKLWTAVVLCVIFITVEVIGGIKSNSLAILTDAAHLLSDVASFGISLFSLWAASWEATPRQSYGFFRIEILGTLVSIQLIWLVTGIIVYEAVYRLINGTTAVQGSLMFLVAGFGVIVNLIMALMLGHDHGHGHGHGGHDHGHGHGHGGHDHGHGHGHGGHDHSHDHHGHDDVHGHGGHDHVHGHDHGSTISRHDSGHSEHEDHINEPLIKKAEGKKRNINVHGAYLHVIGDLIQSVGVMIGGAIIWYKPSWKIVDLICTLIFSIVVLKTTINLLRNILEVLMESTPREIDATSLEEGLRAMDEVTAVHELHIWAITVGKILLACHVKITPDADADKVLEKVVDYIKRVYNISHVTIQIER